MTIDSKHLENNRDYEPQVWDSTLPPGDSIFGDPWSPRDSKNASPQIEPCIRWTIKYPWTMIYAIRVVITYPALVTMTSQIAKLMWPTSGPPGSCRPQMGPILAPWTLLSDTSWFHTQQWLPFNSNKIKNRMTMNKSHQTVKHGIHITIYMKWLWYKYH